MSSRPKIVATMADDLGYGDMGAFNEGAINTPALNSLAEEDVCLSQHYVGSAVCAPSRRRF